jgi:hypothetical protein
MLVEDISGNKCFFFQIRISDVLHTFVTYLLTPSYIHEEDKESVTLRGRLLFS